MLPLRLAICVLVFAFTAGKPLRSQDSLLKEELESFKKVENDIKSWEGKIELVVVNEGKQQVSSGEFAWQATPFKNWCLLNFPTTFEVRDSATGRSKVLDNGGAFREVILTGGYRAAVWLNIPETKIDGFESSTKKISQQPFRLVEKNAIKRESLSDPDLEFFPDFMFRGNFKSLHDALNRLAGDDATVLTRRTSTELSLELDLGDAGRVFAKMEEIGGWVPVEFDGPVSSVKWTWQRQGKYLVPVRLHIEETPIAQTRTYSISEWRINNPIASEKFDIDNLDVEEGDRLADRINNRLYVYKSGKFVPFINDRSADSAVVALQVVGWLIILFTVVAIIYRKRRS